MEKGVNAIQQRSGKKKRIWIKRVLAMMIVIGISSGTVWAERGYADGFGFDTGEMDRLAAEVDQAEKAYQRALAALRAAEEDRANYEAASEEDEKNNRAVRSYSGKAASVNTTKAAAIAAAKAAADGARRALQLAQAKYRNRSQRSWNRHHTNRAKKQKQRAMKRKRRQKEARLGDPVGITTGVYILEEQEWVIERSYRSRAKGKGALGKWWASSLDERIIHGVNIGAPEYYKATENNKNEMDRLYESSKQGWETEDERNKEHSRELGAIQTEITSSYNNASHIYERYQVLTALNKYTVNSETPEYYWGCGNEKLVWVDNEGFPCIYEMSGKGVWLPVDEGKKQYSRIESRDGGGADSAAGFILYEKGGVKKYFNKWGLLERIEYSPYEAITYIRNDEQQAIRIEMPHHQVYQLRYNAGGNVSRVTDPAGRMVRYSYESGILVSVMDEAGDEVRYEYNYEGLLEKIIKPDDSRITIIYGETDAEGNAYVTATEDEEGNRESFEYHREEKYTVHRNHSGVVEKILYDDKHRTVKEEKADGSVIAYEYDEKGNKTRVIENGLTTSYTYDERGNCISIQYADGSRETFQYNGRDQKTYAQDRDGVTAEWTYDGAGRCITVRKAGVAIWEGVYDSAGQLTSSREAGLGEKRYGYDANGFVSSVSIRENGMEFTERYTNDAIGRVLRFEDATGQAWTYEYGAKTVTEVTPLGLKKVYWYNNRKDLIAVEEKDGERNESRLTQLNYDRRHLVKEVRDGARNVTHYEYRADGKVISEKRGAWEKRYEYDSAGRIAKIIQKKAGASEAFETSAAYSLQGADRVQVFTDGLGNKQVYRYDAWSRLTEQINAIGESIKKQYSAGGAMLTAQGSYGGSYRYGYEAGLATSFGKDRDSAVKRSYSPTGLLLSETDRDGKQRRYSYTERGLLKTIGTDEGTISYTYDGAGRVIEQTSYTEANGHSYRTRYRYDGRTVTEERGAYTTTYALDGWGNPIRKTDGEGWSERYRYDATRRLYVHVQPSCPVLQNAKLGTA